MELKLSYPFPNTGRIETFNRTSMELKLNEQITVPIAVYDTFNRTSMELKRVSQRATQAEVNAFNRTSMELKRTCIKVRRTDNRLLIEPVWN